MSKIELDDVKSGYNLGKINANFAEIQRVIDENVLMRDNADTPTEPNQMEGELDMNSKRIMNVGEPQCDTDAVNLRELQKFILENDKGAEYAVRAETAAENAEDSEEKTTNLYEEFRDDYAGSGSTFPHGEDDGTLFYYEGPKFTQGL